MSKAVDHGAGHDSDAGSITDTLAQDEDPGELCARSRPCVLCDPRILTIAFMLASAPVGSSSLVHLPAPCLYILPLVSAVAHPTPLVSYPDPESPCGYAPYGLGVEDPCEVTIKPQRNIYIGGLCVIVLYCFVLCVRVVCLTRRRRLPDHWATAVLVISQLSGTHGSWTRSDDVRWTFTDDELGSFQSSARQSPGTQVPIRGSYSLMYTPDDHVCIWHLVYPGAFTVSVARGRGSSRRLVQLLNSLPLCGDASSAGTITFRWVSAYLLMETRVLLHNAQFFGPCNHVVPPELHEGTPTDQINGNQGSATNMDDVSMEDQRQVQSLASAGGGGESRTQPPVTIVNEAPRGLGSKRAPNKDKKRSGVKHGGNPGAHGPSAGIVAGSSQVVAPVHSDVPVCRRYKDGECRARECRFRHPDDDFQRFDDPAEIYTEVFPHMSERAVLVVYSTDYPFVYLHTGDKETSGPCRFVRQFDSKQLGLVRMYSGPDGFLYPGVREGTIVQSVKQSRHGTMVLGAGGSPAVALGCLVKAFLPVRSTGVFRDQPREVLVLHHLFQLLRKHHPCASPEERQLKHARAWASRLGCYTGLWDDNRRAIEMLDGTLAYHADAIVAANMGSTLTRAGYIRVADESPQYSHDTLECALYPCLGPTGDFVTVQPSTAQPVPFQMHDRVQFRLGPGTTWPAAANPEHTDMLSDVGVPLDSLPSGKRLPVFRTFGVSQRDMSYELQARIRGTGSPFTVVEDSTLSLYQSAKRYWGYRDNEPALVLYERACQNHALLWSRYRRYLAEVRPSGANSALLRYCRRVEGRGNVYDGVVPPAGPVRLAIDAMAEFVDTTFGVGPLRRLLDGVGTCVDALGRAYNEVRWTARNWALHVLARNSAITDHVEHRRRFYSELDGPKRKERIQFVAGIAVHFAADRLVPCGRTKQKRELMKVGKVGRLFTSLGKGGMAAPELPAIGKALLNGIHNMVLTYQDITIDVTIFCPLQPSAEDVATSARLHSDCHLVPNTAVITAYSDDSNITINLRGQSRSYNTDISACDQSHGVYMFGVAHAALSALCVEQATALVEQCLEVKISNPADESEYFFAQPNGARVPFLVSGSVLTTFINTLATIQIGLAQVFGLMARQPANIADWDRVLVDFALLVGYNITLEPAELDGMFDVRRLELLRRRYDPDTDQVFLDPVAYLRRLGSRWVTDARSYGWSPAQLHAATPLMRLHRTCSQTVNGLVHEPPNAFLDVLRERFADRAAPAISWRGTEVDMLGDTVNLGAKDVTEAVKSIHGLSDQDVTQLCLRLRHFMPGQDIQDTAMSKMLRNTYSVAPGGEVALVEDFGVVPALSTAA